MNLVDMRTVFFIIIIVTGMFTLFLAISWRQNRSRYEGINFWVGDFFFQTLGELFVSLRGFIPDLFSILISNILIIFGSILGYIGIEYYLNKKTGHKFNIAMIICFTFLFSYFTFIKPNLAVRSLLMGIFWLINNIRSLYLMLHRAEKSTLSFTKPLIYSYVLFTCLSSVRIIEFLISRNTNTNSEYFQSGLFERLVLFFILVVVITLTYGIILSLNKRLVVEVKKQEKKYSKIFNSSSNAIMITSLKEGKLLEVNNGFIDMLGYDADDLIGHTTQELKMWPQKEDRAKFINDISNSGKVRNLEVNFLKKTGDIITGVISSDIININGEEVILSIINDITERKAMEQRMVEMSNRDPLTNVYNRRYIFSKLETIFKDHKTETEGFSISIIDIDHFKRVNDEYGHQGGDVVLIEFTKTINKMIRSDDFLGRYGGEEFIIVSLESDKEETAKMIETILEVIRDSKVIYDNREIRYTFSCGISDTFEFGKLSFDIETIINQADSRLYEAKNNGRNQIKY